MDIKNLNKNGVRQYVNMEKYGLTAFALKIIAVITMFIDHFAVLFVYTKPYYYILRGIGRLSFPIFAFLIVEGFFHTSDRRRYAIRLAVFAIISEIPYDLAFSWQFVNNQKQNIFITLLIGLLAIWALHNVTMGEVKYPQILRKVTTVGNLQSILKFLIMVVACVLGYLTKCSYSYAGVFLILCFYIFYEYHVGKALANAFFNLIMFGGIQSFGTFSVIPIALYNGKRGKYKWKWFFYLFYPVHLLVLIGMKYIIYLVIF